MPNAYGIVYKFQFIILCHTEKWRFSNDAVRRHCKKSNGNGGQTLSPTTSAEEYKTGGGVSRRKLIVYKILHSVQV